MSRQEKSNDTEARIVDAARQLFLQKGYAATSMSAIAAAAGINRPALHYYFRTKDVMFHAVAGRILQDLAPQVLAIIMRQDAPISWRIERVVDVYYEMLRQNPSLPLFVVKEMERDADAMLDVMHSLRATGIFRRIASTLRREMRAGHIRHVPLYVVVNTFYSVLIFPFLTRRLSVRLFCRPGETFDDLLNAWKPYVTRQILHLLVVEPGQAGNEHEPS